MEKVSEIYKKYKIMSALQEHQLRVASVASMICESLPNINKQIVITACLFHDMGNIIKFDLSYFPEFTEPEGLEYWEKVKKEYTENYGYDEHVATQEIAKEIGMQKKEINCLDSIGFSKLIERIDDRSLENKICCYADQRVGPHGVISIQERLNEGRKRYSGRTEKTIASDKFEVLASALQKLENQIFSTSSINPKNITDETIEPFMIQLKEY